MQQEIITQPSLCIRFLPRSVLALCFVFFASVPAPAFSLDILIGSSQTGTFNHNVARVLCRLINAKVEDVECAVLAAEEGLHSSDYIHTRTNVRNGALDLGIVDASIQYDAVNRSGQFEFFDMSLDNLRSLFSLNAVLFTVIARGDEGLKAFSDLKGRKVNVGNPGSPQRLIMDDLMRVNGWTRRDFALMEELPATKSQDNLALCFGTVDAVIRFDVHPNAGTRNMVDLCDARLLSVSGPVIDKLISDRSYFSTSPIPGGTYSSNSEAVATIGLVETVIVTEDLDEETAYNIVKSVFEQLDRLRGVHPAFSTLDPADMHARGLSMPLHPGALKYYREQGWVQ